MNSPPLTFRESFLYGAAGLFLFVGLWTLLSVTGLVPRQFLPSPFEVAGRFFFLLTSPFAGATLPEHLSASFMRYAYGVVLAAAIGIPLGLLMGWFRLLDDIVSPIFDGLRFIAPIAWVPFAALWFGTGIGGPVMIIFAGAFPPCLINAYRGARFVEPRLIEAARMLGTGHVRMILEILLPAAVPSIIAGLRVSAGLGWQSLVGAELIVAAAGVGFMMVQAQGSVQTPTVMAGMVAIGLVGMVIDILLRRGEGWLRRRRGLEA
ncbi:MAG: ABC transporter permease [Methylobacterium sp.]|jgi:ABC-type nitrate/sulfonate/bicarbonate transport system permease component|nr:ABC transporter permease [Methylobacterium sp.]MCE2933837.1 ABC transporter permease [Hyphomicrobiales bacterium]MCZ8271865.1 ABC transporter permease [Beijerinckiaceae bacterium]MCA3637250.1 ABC transporter permease [Methylobacterium sp.]MCA3640748.1 ABC transporter permease [Methylobacterium sp.]